MNTCKKSPGGKSNRAGQGIKWNLSDLGLELWVCADNDLRWEEKDELKIRFGHTLSVVSLPWPSGCRLHGRSVSAATERVGDESWAQTQVSRCNADAPDRSRQRTGV